MSYHSVGGTPYHPSSLHAPAADVFAGGFSPAQPVGAAVASARSHHSAGSLSYLSSAAPEKKPILHTVTSKRRCPAFLADAADAGDSAGPTFEVQVTPAGTGAGGDSRNGAAADEAPTVFLDAVCGVDEVGGGGPPPASQEIRVGGETFRLVLASASGGVCASLFCVTASEATPVYVMCSFALVKKGSAADGGEPADSERGFHCLFKKPPPFARATAPLATVEELRSGDYSSLRGASLAEAKMSVKLRGVLRVVVKGGSAAAAAAAGTGTFGGSGRDNTYIHGHSAHASDNASLLHHFRDDSRASVPQASLEASHLSRSRDVSPPRHLQQQQPQPQQPQQPQQAWSGHSEAASLLQRRQPAAAAYRITPLPKREDGGDICERLTRALNGSGWRVFDPATVEVGAGGGEGAAEAGAGAVEARVTAPVWGAHSAMWGEGIPPHAPRPLTYEFSLRVAHPSEGAFGLLRVGVVRRSHFMLRAAGGGSNSGDVWSAASIRQDGVCAVSGAGVSPAPASPSPLATSGEATVTVHVDMLRKVVRFSVGEGGGGVELPLGDELAGCGEALHPFVTLNYRDDTARWAGGRVADPGGALEEEARRKAEEIFAWADVDDDLELSAVELARLVAAVAARGDDGAAAAAALAAHVQAAAASGAAEAAVESLHDGSPHLDALVAYYVAAPAQLDSDHRAVFEGAAAEEAAAADAAADPASPPEGADADADAAAGDASPPAAAEPVQRRHPTTGEPATRKEFLASGLTNKDWQAAAGAEAEAPGEGEAEGAAAVEIDADAL